MKVAIITCKSSASFPLEQTTFEAEV